MVVGKIIEKRHLVILWTPCVSYYFDLMLEEIRKLGW